MMRRAPLVLRAVVIALATLPSSALAQDWSQPWADPEDRPARVDVSASGGFLLPTRWSDLVLLGSSSPAVGALQQILTRDVHVKPNTEFTAAVTYWKGRYGARVHTGFSRSTLTISGPPLTGTPSPTNVSGNLMSVGTDTWLYDVGGAIGFVEYEPRRMVWPYGFVGLGGITYNLKQTVAPPLTFIDRGPSTSPQNTIVVVSEGQQFLISTNALSTETVFALNFGIGSDFRIPLRRGGLALRLEVADDVASSPIEVRVEELSPLGGVPSDTGVRQRLVHHLTATAGFVVQFGR